MTDNKPVFVTLPVLRRFRARAPSGDISYHQVLQDPTDELPLYILRDEVTGLIVPVPQSEIVYADEKDT